MSPNKGCFYLSQCLLCFYLSMTTGVRHLFVKLNTSFGLFFYFPSKEGSFGVRSLEDFLKTE